MSQTIGNWSVDPMYTDTITTPKSLSIADIDYAADMSEAVSPNTRDIPNNSRELYFTNSTGSLVTFPEAVYYGVRDVKNVYYAEDRIDPTYQLAQKGGTKVYCTLHSKWAATNTVSGEEKIVPFTGTISIQIPNAAVVNEAMVEAFLKRLVSHMFGTSETSGSMAAKMLRGDLDPTR